MKVKILLDIDRYFQVGSSMKDRDKIKMFAVSNTECGHVRMESVRGSRGGP